MINYKLATISVLISALLAGCGSDSDSNNNSDTGSNAQTAGSTQTEDNTAKYVFLFIGDGMASPQIGVTETALELSDISRSDNNAVITAVDKAFTTPGTERLNMSYFPVAGSATTYAEDRLITDSAAAGTALAAGYKTAVGVIGKNGEGSEDLVSMAELAHQKGMAVGIVSSVDIDHATPASFYAHADERGYYNYIAAQMADSGFEYFAGGHAKGNEEKYRAADKNPEGWEAKDIEQRMSDAGYTITMDRASLNAAVQAGGKVWGYTEFGADYEDGDSSGALPYTIDNRSEDITLAEFTQAGIDLLSTDEDGFFMMVEGGKIDWALHANDSVAAIQDMVAFDEALGKAIAFYNAHPDETLIVVTGDHECGGLTLGATQSKYASNFQLLQYQDLSSDKFELLLNDVMPQSDEEKQALLNDEAALEQKFQQVLSLIKTHFGLGEASLDEVLTLNDYEQSRLYDAYLTELGKDLGLNEAETKLIYNKYNPIKVTALHLLNEKAGIGFTSYSHTAVPVPVFALGVGEDKFDGSYDNTDIAKKIMTAAALTQ